MPKANAPLLAFNRGEVSRIALARVDNERMRLSAQCQVNWLPFVVGPMMLRPGLGHIESTPGDAKATMIDFVYAPDDTALPVLTDSAMQVMIGDAYLTRTAVSTLLAAGGFSGAGWDTSDTTSGCTAVVAAGLLTLTATARGGIARAKQSAAIALADRTTTHGIKFTVTNGPVTVRIGSVDGNQNLLTETVLDTGTHSLTFNPHGNATIFVQIESRDVRAKTLTGCQIEAAGTVSVPTPWIAADLPNLRWTQSGDVVYVAAYGKQQYKIERRGTRPGAKGWSVVAYRSDDGPFGAIPTSKARLTPDVYEGNGTLKSDQPFFDPAMVGALFRVFTPGQTNQATLGASGAFSEAIRVSGVGNDRIFGWNVSAGFVGTVTLQRSVVGADTGFVDVANTTVTGLFTNDDSGSYNNAVCWYRLGFKPGDYTSGSTVVYFGQTVAAAGGGTVGPTDLSAGNTFTAALQAVSGLLTTRTMNATVSNTFVGTITLQRSTAGGAGPWTDWADILVGEDTSHTKTVQVALPTLDPTTWWRLGFKGGNYTSGTATCALAMSGLGGTGGSPSTGAGALAGGRFGIARVTGYTSSKSVNIETLAPFSSLNQSDNWQMSDWSDYAGWPSSPAFQEGRLWWLGSAIWGSRPSNFTSYAQLDVNGLTYGDGGAIIEAFGEGPADRINWGLPLTRLLCGRERSTASIRSSSFDEVVTPTNFSVKDCSEQGAARLPAIKLGKGGIFVQQSGRKVYELLFNAQALDYTAHDLTRLNTDIGSAGFVDAAAAVQPDKVIYLPRGDGQVACLLYDPDDEVMAWWRIMTLGVVENVRVLPNSSGGDDLVYFVVKRTINGVTRRFIEKMALRAECVGGTVNKLFDSFYTYTGAAVGSITIAHLPNTTVGVWADGAYIGNGTTGPTGVLVLPDGLTHSNIVAGLTGSVETFTLAPGANPVSSMTGLSAYEGLPGELFADQQPSQRMVHCGPKVVSGGAIALATGQQAASMVACFGFVAPFMSAKLAYANARGNSPITQTKKIDHLGLVLYDAGGDALHYGQRFDQLEPMPTTEGGDTVPAAQVWREYDERPTPLDGEWDTDTRLCLLAQAPKPVKVGAAVVMIKDD